MRRFLVAFLLSSTLAFGQTYPPDSGGTAYEGGSVTNPFLAPNGTDAAPAYSFTLDTDQGMWRNGSGQLVLQGKDTTTSGNQIIIDDDDVFGDIVIEVIASDGDEASVTLKNAGGVDTQVVIYAETSAGAVSSTTTFDNQFTSFTDPLRAADGSEGTPSHSFTSDTDVGLYRTADVLGLAGPAGVQLPTILFASLPAASNGVLIYCSDCTKATPCATAGSGALAKRLNGAWDCD